jgi:peptidoglycan-associated lipoprotein
MKKHVVVSLYMMLGLTVMLSACAKKPVMESEPPAAPEAPSPVAEVAPVASSATLTTLTGAQLESVYFDYDSYNLSPAAQQTLAADAALLLQESTVKVTIEGHCDERGSDEYNLALGAQRATSVKTHLVSLGVNADRLTTISYGEERPAVTGSDDAAWSKNRRAAFN